MLGKALTDPIGRAAKMSRVMQETRLVWFPGSQLLLNNHKSGPRATNQQGFDACETAHVKP